MQRGPVRQQLWQVESCWACGSADESDRAARCSSSCGTSETCWPCPPRLTCCEDGGNTISCTLVPDPLHVRVGAGELRAGRVAHRHCDALMWGRQHHHLLYTGAEPSERHGGRVWHPQEACGCACVCPQTQVARVLSGALLEGRRRHHLLYTGAESPRRHIGTMPTSLTSTSTLV